MNLLFDFNPDRATKTIHITREFAADRDLVWDAFTKSEILDLWTPPKPFRLETKEMDFRVGGRWLYAMIFPDNSKKWSLVQYLEIDAKNSFTTRNTFSDENGDPVSDAFSITKNSFTAGKDITTVHIEKKFEDLATLEMMVTNGFREGLGMGLKNLEEFLQAAMAG